MIAALGAAFDASRRGTRRTESGLQARPLIFCELREIFDRLTALSNEQAIVEKDPQKLLALVAEINKLLEEKHNRLNAKEPLTINGMQREKVER